MADSRGETRQGWGVCLSSDLNGLGPNDTWKGLDGTQRMRRKQRCAEENTKGNSLKPSAVSRQILGSVAG